MRGGELRRYPVGRQYRASVLVGPDYWQRVYWVRPHWSTEEAIYKRLTWARMGPMNRHQERRHKGPRRSRR